VKLTNKSCPLINFDSKKIMTTVDLGAQDSWEFDSKLMTLKVVTLREC